MALDAAKQSAIREALETVNRRRQARGESAITAESALAIIARIDQQRQQHGMAPLDAPEIKAVLGVEPEA